MSLADHLQPAYGVEVVELSTLDKGVYRVGRRALNQHAETVRPPAGRVGSIAEEGVVDRGKVGADRGTAAVSERVEG